MKIIIKSIMIAAFAALAIPAWAAQTASTGSNAPAAVGTFGQDEILGFIVVLLLIPVIALGTLFRNLVLQKFRTKYGNGGKGGALLTAAILLLAGQSAFAAGNSGPFAIFGDFTPVTWALLALFFLEMALIIFFATQISSIVNPKVYGSLGERETGWWEKINALRPLGEEAAYETGHDYDGIRELDNVIPPWFTAAFLLSIIFAGAYLYRYHVSHSAPLMLQEYKSEMEAASLMEKERLATQGAQVDETNVTMLGADDINFGKTTFNQYCTPCHMSHGGSAPNGVGPNLTDDYWIHGGSIQDVFKSIKYGWPEKGMISWKDQLSANQMAQVASFIKSIQGTNPPGAKAPQGELYKEVAATPAKAPAATDSTSQARPK